MAQSSLQPVVRRATILELEEAGRVRESKVSRRNPGVEVRGRATGDGDGAVWVLRHKRGACRNVHVSTSGSRNDAGLGERADLTRICGSAGSQQVRTAGANVANFEQPSLSKIALDVEVPLLRIGRAETPNGEEEEARERSSAGALEDGRAGRSVKTDECGHHLVGRKREGRVGQDAGKWILRRHCEWRGADGFVEGQPTGSLQKGLVGDTLIVDAVSGADYGFLVTKYVPSVAYPRGEISRAEASRQRAARNAGSADILRLLRVNDADRPWLPIFEAPEVGKKIIEFMSGAQSFPTQSKVQREPGLNLPVVLDIGGKIQGSEVKAREASFCLCCIHAPQQEVLETAQGRRIRKAWRCIARRGVAESNAAALRKIVEAVE